MASEALRSFTTPCKVHVAIVPALHCMGSNVKGNGDQEARNGVTEIHTTPLDILLASMSAAHFYTQYMCTITSNSLVKPSSLLQCMSFMWTGNIVLEI